MEKLWGLSPALDPLPSVRMMGKRSGLDHNLGHSGMGRPKNLLSAFLLFKYEKAGAGTVLQ